MDTRSALLLAAAIAFELVGTNALKASQGFSRPVPSTFVVLGYGAAFYCLGLALKTIPIGVAYAIWSGVGTAAMALLGRFLFAEMLTPVQWGGIALVVLGVLALHLGGGAPTAQGT